MLVRRRRGFRSADHAGCRFLGEKHLGSKPCSRQGKRSKHQREDKEKEHSLLDPLPGLSAPQQVNFVSRAFQQRLYVNSELLAFLFSVRKKLTSAENTNVASRVLARDFFLDIDKSA